MNSDEPSSLNYREKRFKYREKSNWHVANNGRNTESEDAPQAKLISHSTICETAVIDIAQSYKLSCPHAASAVPNQIPLSIFPDYSINYPTA
mmetsp:Transcript_20159/g.44001  ORF Transcript_20159/g.44001 Transcript_20159/m.44001 type:complete len:92 (+) Transcript_20159:814-1089(+)